MVRAFPRTYSCCVFSDFCFHHIRTSSTPERIISCFTLSLPPDNIQPSVYTYQGNRLFGEPVFKNGTDGAIRWAAYMYSTLPCHCRPGIVDLHQTNQYAVMVEVGRDRMFSVLPGKHVLPGSITLTLGYYTLLSWFSWGSARPDDASSSVALS